MNDIIKFDTVEQRIITLHGEKVILDSDVAELYGVETKRVNEAVKNNPEKFPEGYIILPDTDELKNLRSKFSTTKLSMTRVEPKAFTEKGLYMLATILKSEKATQTTLAIVETFAKFRELSRTIVRMSKTKKEFEQKKLTQKSADLFTYLLGNTMKVSDSETSVELNIAAYN